MVPEVLWLHRRAPIPEIGDPREPPRGPAKEAEVREEALLRLREIDELGLGRDRARYAAYMGALSRRSASVGLVTAHVSSPPQTDRSARETVPAARKPGRAEGSRQLGGRACEALQRVAGSAQSSAPEPGGAGPWTADDCSPRLRGPRPLHPHPGQPDLRIGNPRRHQLSPR